MNPVRSLLYVPAARPRMLARFPSLSADAVVIDLEDGVAPSEKAAARERLRRLASTLPSGPRPGLALRINPVDGGDAEEELALLGDLEADLVILPKAEQPEVVAGVAAHPALGACGIGLMIETATGVGRVRELAAADPRVEMLIVGSADLRLSLGAHPDPERRWESLALQEVLLAARMHECQAIDSVFFRFRDREGLRRHAGIGRTLGFDGKSCIHPDQLEVIHEVFGCTPEEAAWARGVLSAWNEQQGEQRGVVVADGEMIEELHVRLARRMLARSGADRREDQGETAP